MTQLAAHKQLVLQYVELFNRGDFAALQKLFTPDALIQDVLGWGGLDKALPIWKELHQAFEIELTVEDMIAEGDVVAVRYIERGKFIGPFRWQEPTEWPYKLVALEWFTLLEGKIHRRWGARDAASQARQLGMQPTK